MQPIYCTWEANGAVAHTPGLFKRGRVTEARGWVNAAVGELARLWVQSNDSAAREQEWAILDIKPAEGCKVTVGKDGTIRIERGKEER